jgi:hypothetical protein
MLANLADLPEAVTKNISRKILDRFPDFFSASRRFRHLDA